jgi:hypothetical protein
MGDEQPWPVSLKAHGLRTVGSLECPAGGRHHIDVSELTVISKRGRGAVKCRKCGRLVLLRGLEG